MTLLPGEDIFDELKPGERVVYQRTMRDPRIHGVVKGRTKTGRYIIRFDACQVTLTTVRCYLVREGATVKAGV